MSERNFWLRAIPAILLVPKRHKDRYRPVSELDTRMGMAHQFDGASA
jgi:hypothetical protein